MPTPPSLTPLRKLLHTHAHDDMSTIKRNSPQYIIEKTCGTIRTAAHFEANPWMRQRTASCKRRRKNIVKIRILCQHCLSSLCEIKKNRLNDIHSACAPSFCYVWCGCESDDKFIKATRREFMSLTVGEDSLVSRVAKAIVRWRNGWNLKSPHDSKRQDKNSS